MSSPSDGALPATAEQRDGGLRVPADGLLLHLGSGPHAEPGWINVDKSWMAPVSRSRITVGALRRLGVLDDQQVRTQWPPDVIRQNLTRAFPWPACSTRAIYSSHMVEHLERAEARRFLEECERVLMPGGVLRLALPNLETLVAHYLRAKAASEPCAADEFVDFLYLVAPNTDSSRLRRLAKMLLHRAHRWMYDPSSMEFLLRDIGFDPVRQCSFRVGACPDLETLETRQHEVYEASSFYVEAFKAGRSEAPLTRSNTA